MFATFVFGITCLPKLFSFSRFDFIMILITIVCMIMSHEIYKLAENTLSDFHRLINKFKKKKVYNN